MLRPADMRRCGLCGRLQPGLYLFPAPLLMSHQTICNESMQLCSFWKGPYISFTHHRLNHISLHSLCTQDERLQAGRLDFLGGRNLGGAGRLVEMGYSHAQEHVSQIDRHFGVVASAAATSSRRLDNRQATIGREGRDWDWNQHGHLEGVVLA